jgi:carbonic anhydrase
MTTGNPVHPQAPLAAGPGVPPALSAGPGVAPALSAGDIRPQPPSGGAQVHPNTPGEALRELLAGNERFVSGTRVHPHQDAERRTALVSAQRPFAVIFGCSDSRLAAEIIFDRGLGDLFVVRTAGQIVGPEVQASIEYGIHVLGAPLLVVLGHDSCGAIRAAYDAIAAEPARLSTPDARAVARPSTMDAGPIVERIRPSMARAASIGISDLDEISAVHVRQTVEQLIGSSLAPFVRSGSCEIVGLAYRLAEGRVSVVASSTVAAATTGRAEIVDHSG